MPLDQKKIGKTITYLRKQAGYTQKGLADRLFISDKAVSKWERGLSVPDIAYLGKLSVLLDTDIETLLEGKHVSRGNCWKGFLITDSKSAEVSLLTRIYDKPLVYYLLSNFLLVGIQEILIVCNSKEAEEIRQLIGTGECLGVHLKIVETNCVSDIGHVINANVEFFRDSDIMTVFEKSVLYGASLTYLYQRAMLNHGQHTLLVTPTVEHSSGVHITFDDTKRVTEQKRIGMQYSYNCMPVMFSPGDLLLRDISEEITLNDMVCCLMKKGSLYVENANRGIIEITINTLDDVVDASELIRILQKRSGTYVACLEEIAMRRRLIEGERLQMYMDRHLGTQYGNYLLAINGENQRKGDLDGKEKNSDSKW